ncbi:MAG: 30S ribosome-binding factor RbfA [Bacteroidales bacterium]|nr:30S ribosome-binding factor RbfA [Bacteroidales bacterium]MDD3859244.1 30S ribosome-binding factor RbfA [Bacteroidales bacterium]
MENSKRQTQVGGLIQKELALIIQKKFSGLVPGRLLTISGVRMSSDLGLAKIYLSIFPSADADKIIKEINKNVSKIRFELGNSIRNDVRRIPELVFYLDDSLDYLERIDNALNS